MTFQGVSAVRFSKSGRVSYAILIFSQEKTFIFFHPKMKRKNLLLTSLTLQSVGAKEKPVALNGLIQI
ncbi:hypothetical protein BCT23_24720 [Enterovibrio norvegicus]|uniref:Uncharacterized protein n=1 Tax=Enterovibrio norvegicus TaxID=188144 RepID=A0A2N7L315_9GAMM|nr:hypothetical protein BCT23_24720 [Enterovibrio norvegicus]